MGQAQTLFSELSNDDVDYCAKRLLGAVIERNIDNRLIRAQIVETEGYDQRDPASHSFNRTDRSEVMFGSAGLAYVYFIYGMYHCLNVVCGPAGFGSAVLIRAAEPLEGQEYLLKNRRVAELRQTLNGPGKLCQALDITRIFNGHRLSDLPLKITLSRPTAINQIVTTTRIGITKAANHHRRFYLKDNPYVSRP